MSPFKGTVDVGVTAGNRHPAIVITAPHHLLEQAAFMPGDQVDVTGNALVGYCIRSSSRPLSSGPRSLSWSKTCHRDGHSVVSTVRVEDRGKLQKARSRPVGVVEIGVGRIKLAPTPWLVQAPRPASASEAKVVTDPWARVRAAVEELNAALGVVGLTAADNIVVQGDRVRVQVML